MNRPAIVHLISPVAPYRNMHDLVEWAAAQPWSSGEVGMIGISYFAGTQMEAAVERPPHLSRGRCGAATKSRTLFAEP